LILLEHLVAIYVSPRCVVIKISYQSWSDRSTLSIEYGFWPSLLKNAERSLRYHVKENYQNTRIVNEQMVS